MWLFLLLCWWLCLVVVVVVVVIHSCFQRSNIYSTYRVYLYAYSVWIYVRISPPGIEIGGVRVDRDEVAQLPRRRRQWSRGKTHQTFRNTQTHQTQMRWTIWQTRRLVGRSFGHVRFCVVRTAGDNINSNSYTNHPANNNSVITIFMSSIFVFVFSYMEFIWVVRGWWWLVGWPLSIINQVQRRVFVWSWLIGALLWGAILTCVACLSLAFFVWHVMMRVNMLSTINTLGALEMCSNERSQRIKCKMKFNGLGRVVESISNGG